MNALRISCVSNRLVIPFFLFFCVVLITSCSGVSHVKLLREIQDEFNSVTFVENQLIIDPNSSDATILGGQSYGSILVDVTKLINEKSEELRTDDLLGSAYTLKALTEWRLGDYKAAVNTSNKVINEKIKLFPRDHALIIALRGLIKNDQAFDHMMKKDYEYKDLKRLLIESVENINEGEQVVPSSNNVVIYLYIAKLAVLKNWLNLYSTPTDYAISQPEDFDVGREQDEWCKYALQVWNEFSQQLNRINTQEAKNTIKFWEELLLLPGACIE